MFRHFAILTLAMTGLLAMFASGENRQALEEQVAARQERDELKAAELRMAEEGKGGNTRLLFKDRRRYRGRWGNDAGVVEAQQGPIITASEVELTGADAPHFVDMQSAAADLEELPEVPPPGMTMEELIEEREQNKRSKSKNGKKQPERMSKAQIDRMIENSRERTNTPDY